MSKQIHTNFSKLTLNKSNQNYSLNSHFNTSQQVNQKINLNLKIKQLKKGTSLCDIYSSSQQQQSVPDYNNNQFDSIEEDNAYFQKKPNNYTQSQKSIQNQNPKHNFIQSPYKYSNQLKLQGSSTERQMYENKSRLSLNLIKSQIKFNPQLSKFYNKNQKVNDNNLISSYEGNSTFEISPSKHDTQAQSTPFNKLNTLKTYTNMQNKFQHASQVLYKKKNEDSDSSFSDLEMNEVRKQKKFYQKKEKDILYAFFPDVQQAGLDSVNQQQQLNKIVELRKNQFGKTFEKIQNRKKTFAKFGFKTQDKLDNYYLKPIMKEFNLGEPEGTMSNSDLWSDRNLSKFLSSGNMEFKKDKLQLLRLAKIRQRQARFTGEIVQPFLLSRKEEQNLVHKVLLKDITKGYQDSKQQHFQDELQNITQLTKTPKTKQQLKQLNQIKQIAGNSNNNNQKEEQANLKQSSGLIPPINITKRRTEQIEINNKLKFKIEPQTFHNLYQFCDYMEEIKNYQDSCYSDNDKLQSLIDITQYAIKDNEKDFQNIKNRQDLLQKKNLSRNLYFQQIKEFCREKEEKTK